jgi:carbonic anhydrase
MEKEPVISWEKALDLLKNGNQRFVSGASAREFQDKARRDELLGGQEPYATILCCSDSRVPPELIFDEGLGRLFVVRVAGNLLTPELLGSIEYASLHSSSRLILVLGHQHCGAITAAVQLVEDPSLSDTPAIQGLLGRLVPVVLRVQNASGRQGDDLVAASVTENVRQVMKQIREQSPALEEMARKGELKICGGCYSLENGKVEFW